MQDLRPVTVFRNSLSAEHLSMAQRLIIGGAEFPWYFHHAANAAWDGSGLDWGRNYQDLPQLAHALICYVTGQVTSPHTGYLLEECGVLNALTRALGVWAPGETMGIYRFKANLLPAVAAAVTTQPHTDHDNPCASALLYLNDSDGDTVFFDRAAGESTDGMSEVARVTPAAGDLVMFDGRQYHAGSPPVRTRGRFVLSLVLK